MDAGPTNADSHATKDIEQAKQPSSTSLQEP